MRRARATGDRGSASVLVLALACVVLLSAVGIAALVQAQDGRSRARAAADLAALAGADHLRITTALGTVPATSPPAAAAAAPAAASCARAREVAERNGASLTACAAHGGGVLRVTVTVPTPVGRATASARAGPRPDGG